jgi:hypothetical protein
MTMRILDEVKVLDQQVTTTRTVAEKRPNFGQRGIVDLTALGRDPAFPGALFLPDALLLIER